MRVAKPDELKSVAVPVMTARVSETELSEWFPIRFNDVNDPEATPEPSKGALLKLTSGPYFVVYWGELSKQLTLQIPRTTDASDFLAAFLREVPLPKSRILWRREDARLPRGVPIVKKAAAPARIGTSVKGSRMSGSRRAASRKK